MGGEPELLTSITFCWRLERRDGAGIALTSHDRTVLAEGVKHEAVAGASPAAVARSAGLTAEPGEIRGAVTSDGLSEPDLAAGRWKGARAKLSAVSWHEEEGVTSLLEGELGAVSLVGGEFSAEMIGPAAALSRAACPTTSPECRASLGDKACRVDLRGRSIRALVTAANGQDITLNRPIGVNYAAGRLRYLRGANCGLASRIISVDGSTVRLQEPPPGPVETGEEVELHEGCDKRFSTCTERFRNALNFRGEPHLPGNDLLTRYPGS